jgi:hypothetical protein
MAATKLATDAGGWRQVNRAGIAAGRLGSSADAASRRIFSGSRPSRSLHDGTENDILVQGVTSSANRE